MNTRKPLVLQPLDDAPTPAAPPSNAGPVTLIEAPEIDAEVIANAAATGAPRHARSAQRLLLAGLVAVGGVAVLQFVVDLVLQLRASPVLGTAWLIATGLLVAGAGGVVWRAWQRLRRARELEDARARAAAMAERNGVGEAEGFCAALAVQTGLDRSEGYARFRQQVQLTHNNREVLALYGRTVLAQADARALEQVTHHAGDVSVMVAVSYFPAVDMLLVLWRQLKLVEDIAAAYGMDPGYWGRIRLLRKVLRNMALAGAAEIATEVGAEAFSAGAAAKLSGALAQGVAAGVLTARLGLRTMDACRAIPWEEGQRPKLRSVSGGVIERARKYLSDSS